MESCSGFQAGRQDAGLGELRLPDQALGSASYQAGGQVIKRLDGRTFTVYSWVRCGVFRFGGLTVLPDSVKKQATALQKSLSAHGWSVAQVEPPFEDEWWAAEIWQIKSEWSPQGVRAYLTFLVDPQGERDDVWAVCASSQRPTERPINTSPSLRLLNVWQRELPHFVRELSQFRVEPEEEAE
jgi:hypothetical protein